jgi:hypothetical protein
MRTIVTAALCASILAGCASSPDEISAAYVSPVQYSGSECDQIRAELVRVSSRVREVAGAQQKQADIDAIAMGVALVVFWPALFFIGGNDRNEELSRLKGEYDALEQAAIQKNCPVASELKAGRGG